MPDEMPDLFLGPFRLLEPIAKGGMGSVWRAIHPEQGTLAAIKVITGDAAREEKYLAAFKTEVRASANLDHPSIVTILDYGEVSPAAASGSTDQLSAGSPYLAMEYASGGSLATARHTMAWSEIKAILLTLLDALAHAHARGVIHRDLKAGNVLVCTNADQRAGLKLTDFGIAHASDWQARSGIVESAAGTLHYMAPEQLLGHWRDYGPWTDLYALGCMAYRLVTGRVPYTGLKGSALLRAQLYQDAPRLRARQELPLGFQAWCDTLMRKDASRRYQRCADAAWALLELGDPDEDTFTGSVMDVKSALNSADPFGHRHGIDPPTTLGALDSLELGTLPTQSRIHALPPTSPPLEPQPQLAALPLLETGEQPPPPPPLAANWRRPLPPPKPIQLIGSGLGLYGLRAIPMVGRERERDHLWKTLRAVHQRGMAHYVLLQGPAGSGKSRLARWLVERAHELGAAEVVQVAHSPSDDPVDGLRRLVGRALMCGRLKHGDILERVEDFYASHGGDDSNDSLALTALLAPLDSSSSSTPRRLSTAGERHTTVRRFLERLAHWRTVIAWFDDVQCSDDAIAFCKHLLEAQTTHPAPILILHTVREEALGAQPETQHLLDELLRKPSAERIDISPLTASETTELVRELLLLDENLAVQVEQRSSGNPDFAIQLVGDWVERRVLEVGLSGFRLKAGVRADLPDDIHAVWAQRIDQLVRGLPPSARAYLERAAALGLEVNEAEWQEACDDPAGEARGMVGASRVALSLDGLRSRAALLDRLSLSHLSEPTEDGFRFLHGMVRESLERTSREAGRWSLHNRACAAMLERRYPKGARERIGRHLLEAGEWRAAVDPLIDGALHTAALRGARPALSLLNQAEDAMKRLKMRQADARWGRVWTLRSQLLIVQGNLAGARRWSDTVLHQGPMFGWDLSEARFCAGQGALQQRDLTTARQLLSTVIEQCTRHQGTLLGRATLQLGEVELQSGHRSRARRLTLTAQKIFEKLHDDNRRALALTQLATIELERSQQKTAWGLFNQAVKVARASGDLDTQARAIRGRAHMLRHIGQHKKARHEYRRAMALYDSVGSWEVVTCRMSLGLVYLATGRYSAARQSFETCRAVLEGGPRQHLHATVLVMLLPCLARRREWAAWDRHLARALPLLKASNYSSTDLGQAAALAGELAEEQRQPKRAAQVFELARSQLDRAANAKDLPPVLAALERLSTRS